MFQCLVLKSLCLHFQLASVIMIDLMRKLFSNNEGEKIDNVKCKNDCELIN